MEHNKSSSDMEVSAKAKRIMVVALGKLYSSRTQRGGLRLHRSLLLTLVMKSARDIYHTSQATAAESLAAEDMQQSSPAETSGDTAGARLEEEGVPVAPSPVTRHPARCDSHALTGGEDKENRGPSGPERHARKRRGLVAAEPDFLPCKKAKLEQGSGLKQVALNSVLVDYGNCGSKLGAHPSPVPVPRAIAAF